MSDGACTVASSLTVRVAIGCGGRWPRSGNPTCKRGSSGLMVGFISRSCRGHIGLLSDGAYVERTYERWSVYCRCLPYGLVDLMVLDNF